MMCKIKKYNKEQNSLLKSNIIQLIYYKFKQKYYFVSLMGVLTYSFKNNISEYTMK